MRIGICVAAIGVVLCCATLGGAGPVQGGMRTYLKVEPGQPISVGSLTFKGGERASVILMGDHEPVMDLAIYIFDDKGKEVAKDVDGGDYCAAIWYPPREAKYTIVLQNKGSVWNKCYLSIK